ncbi:MAG TPA: alpha/beta hydrolase [Candidatus Solibacter sp.]|jgi:pimeloyl-ACP methyl ester carboxylesterase|nr:alpha/beta hydrolase [Candidatus Solibacter sp.]
MTGETPAAEPKKDLDELIAEFEDVARKRPTPAELAEAERTGAQVQHEEPPEPEPAELPIAPAEAVPAEAMPAEVVTPELEVGELATPVAALEAAPAPASAAPAPAAPGPAPSATSPEGIEGWWAAGERVEVQLPGGSKYSIFVRVLGQGPWMTLIHGFPTSSWDWAPIAGALASKYRLLTFDLLGFGDSDKPSGHDFSAFEQADIVEALWRQFGVSETRLVGHDVGMTVALELLARQDEGKLATRMTDLTLLNGGVYAAHHRPRRVQVWLQRPVIGALIASRMSEGRFASGFARIFAPEHQPTPGELHEHWLSVARRNGSKNYHRLIKYIPERRVNAKRWEGTAETSTTPIRYVWGMVDPVSGAHMAKAIKDRRSGADFVELADVGHYPQLEAPDRVAAAIIEGPRVAAGNGQTK